MFRLVVCSILSFLLLSCASNGREEQGFYTFAPTPSTDSALMFMPDIVSTDSIEHSAPTFSADGKTMLWSIMEMPSYKTSILEMNYVDGKWSRAHWPAFSDTTASEVSPFFSPERTRLYFSSSRTLPWGDSPPPGNMLWTVDRTPNGWAEAQPLDTAITRGGDYAPSVSSDGTIYFTHGPFRSPDWNIFSAHLSGTDMHFREVVPTINSASYEDGAFIAPDQSYLIFESDRPGGVGNSIDLYISFRSGDGRWSAPISLGPAINTAASERFARVSPDGKYLFFGSDRRIVNGKPNMDIYWIDASVIRDLKSSSK